jgi:hypothetical protein
VQKSTGREDPSASDQPLPFLAYGGTAGFVPGRTTGPFSANAAPTVGMRFGHARNCGLPIGSHLRAACADRARVRHVEQKAPGCACDPAAQKTRLGLVHTIGVAAKAAPLVDIVLEGRTRACADDRERQRAPRALGEFTCPKRFRWQAYATRTPLCSSPPRSVAGALLSAAAAVTARQCALGRTARTLWSLQSARTILWVSTTRC